MGELITLTASPRHSPHQRLDIHTSRPGRPAGADRFAGARRGVVDVGVGHRAVTQRPAPRRDRTYSFERIARAIALIEAGARCIATNPDPTGPSAQHQCALGVHRHDRRPDGTDIVAGLEAGLETVLVLTGIADRDFAGRFAYLPTHIVESVADLIDDIEDAGTDAGRSNGPMKDTA